DDMPTGSVGPRGFALASAGETILPRVDTRAGTTVLVKTMPADEPAMPPVAAVEVLRKRGWPDRPSAPPKAPAAIAAGLAPAPKRSAEPEDKVALAAPAKLAYAKPDLDVLPSVPAPLSITPGPVRSARDIRTAVYDIEAHTVYLPSGRKLEAHSGLGEYMDNP